MLYNSPTRKFLGPAGAATVLLLNSNGTAPLPTLKEFQRLLKSDDIKIYKGEGWYTNEISYLERAMQIVKDACIPLPWQFLATTEFLLLPPGRSRSDKESLFFLISYASIVVEGFDLTEDYMRELGRHIDAHSEIQRWRETVSDHYETLGKQAKWAHERNLQDQTLLSPDIPALMQIMTGYGDKALADVTAEINHWYSSYKW